MEMGRQNLEGGGRVSDDWFVNGHTSIFLGSRFSRASDPFSSSRSAMGAGPGTGGCPAVRGAPPTRRPHPTQPQPRPPTRCAAPHIVGGVSRAFRYAWIFKNSVGGHPFVRGFFLVVCFPFLSVAQFFWGLFQEHFRKRGLSRTTLWGSPYVRPPPLVLCFPFSSVGQIFFNHRNCWEARMQDFLSNPTHFHNPCTPRNFMHCGGSAS